jgi:hypothetical protein
MGFRNHSTPVLTQSNADELVAHAVPVRDFLDRFKDDEAKVLGRALNEIHRDIRAGLGMPDPQKIRVAIQAGLAQRVGVDPLNPLCDGLPYFFNAFFEYEESRVLIASQVPDYNPCSRKNKNDAFDSEQLVYLALAGHCFLTCDRKYSRRVKKAEQAQRIRTVKPELLADPLSATALLQQLAQE